MVRIMHVLISTLWSTDECNHNGRDFYKFQYKDLKP